MKKLSVFCLIMILAFTVGMFVSCSNETKVDDATATVSFGRADTSRALSSSVGIPGADKLYWSVTATKNDNGLASGAGTYDLNGYGVTGISNNVRLTLSVGSWSFTLKGYTDRERNDASKIYEGTTVETLYKNDSKVINVDVRYCGTTNGYGTVQLDGVLLSNASSVADNLKVEVLTATTPYPNSIFTKSENKTFSGMIRNGDGNPVQITPGVYQVRFTLMNGDKAVLNPLERYVVVLQGRNTVISGDIAEEQASISFKVNILADSYAQFGNYFYVLVDTEAGYQKALEAAAAYTGEGIPVIILSRNLEVDGTTITAADSRAINIGMSTSGIVIDLNGNELKLKATSESDVLITLNAAKNVSIIDTAETGKISAAGKTAIDIKSGTVNISGGSVVASTAVTVDQNATLTISGAKIDATDRAVVNAGTFTMTSGTLKAPTAVTITASNASTTISGGALEAECSVSAAENIEAEVKISGDVKNEGIISGGIKETYGSGTGTVEDPYIISTVGQLKYLASQVNDGIEYTGKFFKLGNDIDLDNEHWVPIGKPIDEIPNNQEPSSKDNAYYGFAGTFDGNGHVISNLKIEQYPAVPYVVTSDTKFKGLFGIVKNGAVIKNVTIENVSMWVGGYSGSLVGYIPKPANGTAEVTLENNTIRGYINVFGVKNIGGLVGRAETNTVLNLLNNTVIGTDGEHVKSMVSIRVANGYSDTVITSTNFFGGLIGSAYGSSVITGNTVNNLVVYGNTEGIGGIAGHVLSATFTDNTVADCEIMNGYEGTAYPNDAKGIGLLAGLVGTGDGCHGSCTHTNVSVSVSDTIVENSVIRIIGDRLNCQGLIGTYRCDYVDGTEPVITGIVNNGNYISGLNVELGVVTGDMLRSAIVNAPEASQITIYVKPPTTSEADAITYDLTNEKVTIGNGKTVKIVNISTGTAGAGKVIINGYLMVTGRLELQNVTIAHTGSNTVNNTPETVSQYTNTAIGLMNEGVLKAENCIFEATGPNDTAITAWWSNGEKGTLIDLTGCTFNCSGQRPIRSDANVTVKNCTFNDPYRYAVQLTAKTNTVTGEDDAVINFFNNTIIAGTTTYKPVYGIQLEGETYGCSDLVVNGSGNSIDLGTTGKTSAMYYCECGKVNHSTITWNIDDASVVHEIEN